MTDLPLGTLSLRVFGSYARGDATAESDLDLLAVLEDDTHTSEPLTSAIELIGQTYFAKKPSVSWYSQNRLRQIFARGDLFAWHLHRESFRITPQSDVLDELGCPAPYSSGGEDVEWFIEILESSRSEVSKAPRNTTYEAGIVFLCLRNIGIICSWYVDGVPSFDKFVPLRQACVIGRPLDISEEDYLKLNRCRVLGGRGLRITPPSLEHLSRLQSISVAWAQEVRAYLFGSGVP